MDFFLSVGREWERFLRVFLIVTEVCRSIQRLLNLRRSTVSFKMERRKSSLVVAAAIMVCAGTASAATPVYSGTYVDMYLKSNTFPTLLNEEKVFLDAALASTITGHEGSQTDTRLVSFSSTTDVLDAANGFATIKAQDGFLNNLTITAPGYWFEDLIFSVNLTPNSNSDLVVTAMDKSSATDSFANWAAQGDWVNGENRILVLSTSGNLMQSVTINSQIGFQSLGGLDQLKQTEISGVTAVPEPETYAMLLAGLGLVGFAARRKLS